VVGCDGAGGGGLPGLGGVVAGEVGAHGGCADGLQFGSESCAGFAVAGCVGWSCAVVFFAAEYSW
jgi:hypothetical protein